MRHLFIPLGVLVALAAVACSDHKPVAPDDDLIVPLLHEAGDDDDDDGSGGGGVEVTIGDLCQALAEGRVDGDVLVTVPGPATGDDDDDDEQGDDDDDEQGDDDDDEQGDDDDDEQGEDDDDGGTQLTVAELCAQPGGAAGSTIIVGVPTGSIRPRR